MKPTERRYFLKRAGNELQNARASASADAAKAHFELARLFLDKAHDGKTEKDVDRYLGASCILRPEG